jgi:hypothetical protein
MMIDISLIIGENIRIRGDVRFRFRGRFGRDAGRYGYVGRAIGDEAGIRFMIIGGLFSIRGGCCGTIGLLSSCGLIHYAIHWPNPLLR